MVKKILKFYADWCGPCKVMAKHFADVDLSNIEFVNVNIDDDANEELVNLYKIRNIPVSIFLDENNEILERVVGIITPSQIQAIIDKYGK